MPGFLLTVASQVTCLHQGKATIVPGQTVVLAGGAPVVTVGDVVAVAGCSLSGSTPPSPCVTVDFALAASTRVFVLGKPVVLEPAGPGAGVSQSAAKAPQGTPVITSTQLRAAGS
ncbi:hypothetical protein ACIHFD_09430 [Nonomuraea sp. NPDC051941]|uniref:hypothetical protein n=1 Tax=Nonomuraea sp. NPDC051941 TaxID=3364373 RepID=UPI0037CA75A7